MADNDLELKIKGLWSSPNPLSETPKGGLREALNIVIDEPSLADSRRGQNFYTSEGFDEQVDQFLNYNVNDIDYVIAHGGQQLKFNQLLDDTGAFTLLDGNFENPEPTYITHGVLANKNLYLTSKTGIKKIELDLAPNGAIDAGAPKALDLDGSLSGSTGFLADDSVVAYRLLWGIKDSQGNLILGAPSSRFIISNSTGGTRDVTITYTIPEQINEAWFYQVYRSVQFSPASSEPNDELYLVLEGNPTSLEIAAKVGTVTDSTPDELLGATLYTSPSQEGIQNSNYAPPYAKDITYYQNMTFYANTESPQRATFNLIGVGSPNLDVGDTITISVTDGATDYTVIYTGAVSENIAANEFLVSTGGTVAENIANTAQSFCRVVNRSPDNTVVYAYYLSGFDDLPGQILIEGRPDYPLTGNDPFPLIIDSSTPNSFNPSLPLTGAQDINPNYVSVSKNRQPEAVPIYTYLPIGSANKPIQRIIALRDAVFVFKSDGIFTITGTDFPSLQVNLLDNSTRLLAPESCAVFNNQILAFVDQGVAAISNSGVQIISRPIEKELLRFSQLPNFSALTFGVGYESDRKFMIWLPTDSLDTFATLGYIYNSASNSWTTWDLPRSAGFVAESIANDTRLMMYSPPQKRFYRERKTFTIFDYVEESYFFNVTSQPQPGTLIVDTTNAEHILVGDVIFQGDNLFSYVESITQDPITMFWTIQLTFNVEFDILYPLEVGKAFTARVEFLPVDQEQPGLIKQFPEFTLFFKEARFDEINIGFKTDFIAEKTNYELFAPTGIGATGDWGNFDWGTINWGGQFAGVGEFTVRNYVPRLYSKGHWIIPSLELTQPLANMSFTGMNLRVRGIGPKYPS